jgi:predicted enzyme related to lactoylglutathione lyase
MEINSPDLERSSALFSATFGWELQPFASPDYLVAPSGDGPGIHTALLPHDDSTGPIAARPPSCPG